MRYEPASLARYRASKEAKKFAASVEQGRTYWTVATNNAADHWLPRYTLETWVFTKRALFTGSWMCGTMSAERLWLTYGPVFAVRPSIAILTHDERHSLGYCANEAQYADALRKLEKQLAAKYPEAARNPQVVA